VLDRGEGRLLGRVTAGRSLSIQAVAVTQDGQDVFDLPNGSSVTRESLSGPGAAPAAAPDRRYFMNGFVNVRERQRLVVAFIVVAIPDPTKPAGQQLDVTIEAPNGVIKRIGDLPRELRTLLP
jgi:hypothetical protein